MVTGKPSEDGNVRTRKKVSKQTEIRTDSDGTPSPNLGPPCCYDRDGD